VLTVLTVAAAVGRTEKAVGKKLEAAVAVAAPVG
jgi:hypothetical protein